MAHVSKQAISNQIIFTVNLNFLKNNDHVNLQEYTAGTAADCKEPLCCRKDSELPSGRRRGAGYWGTYSKCDLPLRTIKNLMENVAAAGPWDWVYWTGDIPAHNVWAQTRNQQLSELKVISRLIHK